MTKPLNSTLGAKERLDLSSGAVHVWSVPLIGAAPELLTLRGLLSEEELARADRFRFATDRDAFTIARATLRLMIARYTGDDPRQIRFNYAPHGKPSIITKQKLSFNLSHSGGLALYAFADDRELGVDIEQFRVMSDLEQVARHFFSKGEVEDLFSLPEEERPAAFFRCWTRKEAFVKALGDGLSLPLDSFRVSIKANQQAELLDVPPEYGNKWSLRDVTPCEGYAAALVLHGRIEDLRYTHFPETAAGLRLLLRATE